jgi:hypothetical protein
MDCYLCGFPRCSLHHPTWPCHRCCPSSGVAARAADLTAGHAQGGRPLQYLRILRAAHAQGEMAWTVYELLGENDRVRAERLHFPWRRPHPWRYTDAEPDC